MPPMPPMPAAGMPMPPPTGPGPRPVPPPAPEPMPAAGPTAQDVEAEAAKADQARVEAMVAAAPTPTSPYKVATIEDVLDAINTLAKKAALDMVLEWDPPAGAKEWPNPLPPEVWLPLAALTETIRQDPAFAKHAFEMDAITDDGALRKVGLQLDRAAGDKKFVDALRAPQPEAVVPETSPETPPPPMPA